MAVGDRVDQFRALARQALHDLFDQRRPFGRLALVQVLMLAGSTLVTISLAGSLFFSISPGEAKSKVFLYLVLTLAPFVVISPLLGPLIDRNRGARRAMAVSAAIGAAVLCPFMAQDVNSLLLFPEAFCMLVLSNLYLVTRNALVPEVVIAENVRRSRPVAPPAAAAGGPGDPAGTPARPADPAESEGPQMEFATLNARLTLLGTLAGFVASIPGIILLKGIGAPAVLVFDAFVFAAAAVAGLRLPVPGLRRSGAGSRAGSRAGGRRRSPNPGRPVAGGDVTRNVRGADRYEARDPAGAAAGAAGPGGGTGWDDPVDADLARLQPVAHPEVLFGLTTVSLMRGLAGFMVFLIAFGLRREHAALWWYGLVLGASGLGSLLGLLAMSRLRQWLSEQQILLGAVWLIAVGAIAAAFWGAIPAQAMLALFVGFAGSLAQPSFDAIAQRFVPLPAQGRAFARFATRQQLVWVLGALIPVVIAFPFPAGDVVMAAVAAVGGLFYVTSRRALRNRALPNRRPADSGLRTRPTRTRPAPGDVGRGGRTGRRPSTP
ncbi:MAG TPA: MFS transporter [Acidimicrobiales bacterium]|nr:MFS transporter [Acidimicrobiales bacterium]